MPTASRGLPDARARALREQIAAGGPTSTTCSRAQALPDAEYDRLFRELQALEQGAPGSADA